MTHNLTADSTEERGTGCCLCVRNPRAAPKLCLSPDPTRQHKLLRLPEAKQQKQGGHSSQVAQVQQVQTRSLWAVLLSEVRLGEVVWSVAEGDICPLLIPSE